MLPASCLFARVCTTYDATQLGKISTKSSSDANTNPQSTNPYFLYEPEFVYTFLSPVNSNNNINFRDQYSGYIGSGFVELDLVLASDELVIKVVIMHDH